MGKHKNKLPKAEPKVEPKAEAQVLPPPSKPREETEAVEDVKSTFYKLVADLALICKRTKAERETMLKHLIDYAGSVEDFVRVAPAAITCPGCFTRFEVVIEEEEEGE